MDYRTILDAATTPELHRLQPAPYIVIDIPVAPGSAELLHALSVLEQLSTMVKATMSGAAEYDGDALYPLEGVWEVAADDGILTFDERILPGQIMIRQADALTPAAFAEHRRRLAQTIETGQQVYLDAARLVTVDEGLCAQILHLGPYNDEPASFAILDRFLQDHQLRRKSASTHREIYLADARTVQPAAYETVLRVQVEGL